MSGAERSQFGYPLRDVGDRGDRAAGTLAGGSRCLHPQRLQHAILQPLHGLDVVQSRSLVQQYRRREQAQLGVRQLMGVQRRRDLH